MGQALGTLETAEQLERLPATAQAFATGALSEAQAREIAAAAEVNPAAERRLLDDAPRQGLGGLKRQCRAAKAAAGSTADAEAAYEAIRRSRFFRCWTESDGAVAGRFRVTPDNGAVLIAAVEACTDQIFA